MKDYPLGVIEPGGVAYLNALGNYVRVIAADAAVKIRATGSKPHMLPFNTSIKPNGSRSTIDIYEKWEVTNTSDVAQDVALLVGVGAADETEVTLAADVNALTRFKNLTAADENTYIGGFISSSNVDYVTPVALNNPADSGFYLNVDVMSIAATYGAVKVFTIGSELVAGGWTSMTDILSMGHNKITGAANGVGEIFVSGGVYADASGYAGFSLKSYLPTDTAGSISNLNFKNSPILVPPGSALCVVANSINQACAATFEWREESVL